MGILFMLFDTPFESDIIDSLHNFLTMERLEYQDDTIPKHVASFLRQQVEEKALKAIEKEDRLAPRMDNDEMREIERGQSFPGYNFMR